MNIPQSLLDLLDGIIDEWNTNAEAKCFPGFPGIACPVPFFGRIDSDKPLIFTIGSNPSDDEFLTKPRIGKSTRIPVSPVRFLDASTSYNSSNLFAACNEYFVKNPYCGWFGTLLPSKMEAFVELLGGSYFDDSSEHQSEYQVVHLDLMPFPTTKKFRDFKSSNSSDVNYWVNTFGIPLVNELVSVYRPDLILCVGEDSNERWLGEPKGKFPMQILKNGKYHNYNYKYYKGDIFGVKAFGTTVYYPDSHGSGQADWKKYIIPLI